MAYLNFPRVIALLIVSLALVWVDARFYPLQSLRYHLGYLLAPSQEVALIPHNIFAWLDQVSKTQQQYQQENHQLHARNQVLELRSQRLSALEVENRELKSLLNASQQLEDRIVLAAVVGMVQSTTSQQIWINRGGKHDLYLGQPVLDAYGLVGQIIDVMPFSAKVMTIADVNHATPVQVSRNGVRAIAQGTGNPNELELLNVASTADIQEGDLLISSGLGGRYPAGYPVAEVTKVENLPGESFVNIIATPLARLERSSQVLLVFKEGAEIVPAPEVWKAK